MSTHTPAHIICDTIQRMTRLGGLKAADRVAVAGPGTGEALSALCRLGFDEALGLSGERCACCCSDGPACALLVPDRLADVALAQRLRNAARCLATTGVVIVRLRDVDQDRVVQAALMDAGFEIGSAVFDLSRRAMVSHVVRRPVALARAA